MEVVPNAHHRFDEELDTPMLVLWHLLFNIDHLRTPRTRNSSNTFPESHSQDFSATSQFGLDLPMVGAVLDESIRVRLTCASCICSTS